MVSTEGEIYAIGGDREPGDPQADLPYIGLERIKKRFATQPTPTGTETPEEAAKRIAIEIMRRCETTTFATQREVLKDLASQIVLLDWHRADKAPVSERAVKTQDFTMQPEPKNPTLWRYLENAHQKQVTFHTIGVSRMPDGGYHFYIHPQSVSGETEDYLIWPDPFDWTDMVVNKKDSPVPDVEKFKALLTREFPSAPASLPAAKGTPTPRTDEAKFIAYAEDTQEKLVVVTVWTARTLETELAAARAEVERLREAIAALPARNAGGEGHE